MSKTIGERHIYTQELVSLLKNAKNGDIISYASMKEKIGMDVTASGDGYGYQKTARDVLERDEAIVFEVIPKLGLRRMTAEEVALSATSMYVKRKKSIIRRSKRRLQTVNDSFETLSPEAQLKTTLARTIIAFDAEMSKPKKLAKIEEAAKDKNHIIGFKNTIDMFKE